MTNALLIVHMQHDVVDAETPFGQMFAPEIARRNVVQKVKEAAASARANGDLVVWLRIAFQPEHSDLNSNMPLLDAVRAAGCLLDGSAGAELVINPEPSDKIITHNRPGPFTNSPLNDLLQAAGVQNVTVAGVATNASVEATVRQAADLGYSVYLQESACSAATAEVHEASVESMKALFLCST